MARLVEVLQVESVVPNLLDGGSIEVLLPDLELDDDDRGADQQHRIDSATQAGDRELEEDRATETPPGRPLVSRLVCTQASRWVCCKS